MYLNAIYANCLYTTKGERVFAVRLIVLHKVKTHIILSCLFIYIVTYTKYDFSGDFMKEGEVYEDLADFTGLKKYMEDQLEDYNMEPGVIPMNLVLFRDAIEHGKIT